VEDLDPRGGERGFVYDNYNVLRVAILVVIPSVISGHGGTSVPKTP
jgi:hypothetical protein